MLFTFRCLTSCAECCVFALKNAQLLGKLKSACRYVKSRSDPQLQGQIATLSSLKNCEPELYQESHNESLRIDPCGLIAWSYFNDTYQVGVSSTQAAYNSAQKRSGLPQGPCLT